MIMIFGIILISIGPFMDYKIKHNSLQSDAQTFEIKLIENPNWIKSETTSINWIPQYINPSAHYQAEYKDSSQSEVGLYLAYYAVQQQDSELVNSQNIMIPQKHEVWNQMREEKQKIIIQGNSETVFETYLSSGRDDILIWHWNVIAGNVIINSYEAKLIEALDKLSGNSQCEYAVVVYTRFEKNDLEASRKKLQQFVNDMIPSITNSFDSLILREID